MISLEQIKIISDLNKEKIIIIRAYGDEISFDYVSSSLYAQLKYNSEEIASFNGIYELPFASEFEKEKFRKGLLSHQSDNYIFTILLKGKNNELHSISGKATTLEKNDSEVFFCACIIDREKEEINEKLSTYSSRLNQLKTIIDFADILTWEYDISNSKVTCSEKMAQILGIEREMTSFPECLVNSQIVDFDYINTFLANHQKICTGQLDEISYTCKYNFHAFENPKFLNIKYIIEKNEANTPIIAYGFAIDISEKQNAENIFQSKMKSFFKMNAKNNLATFQFSLTANYCITSNFNNENLFYIKPVISYDDFINNYLEYIKNKDERTAFINHFHKSNLLAFFSTGKNSIEFNHHLYTKSGENIQVQTIATYECNPLTGEKEIILQIHNINDKYLMEMLIKATVNNEFDFVALLNVENNHFILIEKNMKSEPQVKTDYPEYIINYFSKITNTQDINTIINLFSDNSFLTLLDEKQEYYFEIQTENDLEKSQCKKLHFSTIKENIILLTVMDVTGTYKNDMKHRLDLTKALDEAKKANKAKSEFLSLVSHDIRTPLNGIINMTEFALNEDMSQKAHEFLLKSKQSSEHLRLLIDDLLDMSKIDEGKIVLNPEKMGLNEFNEFIKSIGENYLKDKKTNFKLECETDATSIIVDKQRFNQIFINLISNAIKYTEDGGEVLFKYKHEILNKNILRGTYIVKDNGIGMSPEFMEHLFEKFSMENRMKSVSSLSSGLGLAIIKNLIELMGGKIHVESHLNVGTTFTVEISTPYLIEEAQEEIKATNPVTKMDLTGKRILVVEDNDINTDICVEIIKKANGEYDTASNGKEGLLKFLEQPPYYYDMIFMDMRMPYMDGQTATQLIRTSNTLDALTIPIIAMTGNATAQDKDSSLKVGVNAYLTKPLKLNEVVETVNHLFEQIGSL